MADKCIIATVWTVLITLIYVIWSSSLPESYDPDTWRWAYGTFVALWVFGGLYIFHKYIRMCYIIVSGYIKYRIENRKK